jgi:hypothetical protein
MYDERMGDRRGSYGLLVEKPAGKRPPGRPRHRLMDNIKANLKEGSGGMEWIDLYQDREKWQALVNAVMDLQFLTARSFCPADGPLDSQEKSCST